MTAHGVSVRTLPRQVAAVLGGRIVEAVATHHDIVCPTEQELSAEFNVSRAVAREAIGLLAALDMVSTSQGRRPVLRDEREWDYLNPALVEFIGETRKQELLTDLHEVRLILEPLVAARAAESADTAALGRLEAEVSRMRHIESNPDEYLDADLQFHMELCRVQPNRVLERILVSCKWLLVASRRITNVQGDTRRHATEAHEEIYRAVASADPEAAHQAMALHLETVTPVWVARGRPSPLRDGPQETLSAGKAARDQ